MFQRFVDVFTGVSRSAVELNLFSKGGGNPRSSRTSVRTHVSPGTDSPWSGRSSSERGPQVHPSPGQSAGWADMAAEEAEGAAGRADVAVSLALLTGVVLLSDGVRRMLGRVFAHSRLEVYAAELVSTLQLCCCTHELRVLSEVGGIERRLAHSLTYLAAVVHGLTFKGALGNPAGTLVHVYRQKLALGEALRRIACQFAAATAARVVVRLVWSLGLSEMHVRHQAHDFQCTSPVHAPLADTAVELACAFVVQTAITHTRNLEEKFRVHAVAAVITTAVYAGGPSTGAVFNPALAFSTQFLCSGHSLPEYCLVYWLGPVLGMLGSVLLSDWLERLFWR
uniref:AQP11 n=1 Tax=Bostrychus sinensis TaxID=86224 RepID=A0A891XJ22_9TELE|nr:AQP11 [Bostrychus sinensis]